MSSRRKRAKQEPKRHILPFVVILVISVIVGVVGFGSAGAYALVQTWLTDLPDVAEVSEFNDARKTTVYASDGTTVLASFYAQDREPVTADQVSQNLFNATVAIEDERFWDHAGVDYYGIARAAVVDLTGGDLQGASTITQQLVRQTILQSEMNDTTLKRKVREAWLALELEKQYTKQDVLMMYINTINYGDGSWGIQSAALHYFGKNAADLTVPEAALLAGIPQNPTYNNPVSYPDNALSRRNQVLDRMYVNGYITEAELNEFKATELSLTVQERSVQGILAEPYFTSYVRHVLLTGELFADDGINAEDRVFKGGLSVYTTIDLTMQQYAEDACTEKEAQMLASYGEDQIEVSLVCIDPATGYIKAMRGGKDFYVDQFNTGWQMQRQFGSTFKVFALVAALEQGYSPNTRVSGSSPAHITLDDGRVWSPVNYGGQNMSTLTMASATWVSSNTAYARIAKRLGAPTFLNAAKRMGLQTEQDETALATVLGGTGVNTMEMASAFGTLGNGGVYMAPTPIARIVDYQGNVVYDHETEAVGTQAVTPEVAHAATEVLKGVVTGGTAGSANLGWQVSAGKTGTTENYADSTYVGYTPQLSTAVWIGDPAEQRSIADNMGGSNCCPVWRTFMNNALQGYDAEQFPEAANPPYDSKLTFLTPEEIAAEEEKKKKDEEEKAKEEEEKKKAEEAAKKAEEEAKKAEDDKKAENEKPSTPETGTGSGSGSGGSGGSGSDNDSDNGSSGGSSSNTSGGNTGTSGISGAAYFGAYAVSALQGDGALRTQGIIDTVRRFSPVLSLFLKPPG